MTAEKEARQEGKMQDGGAAAGGVGEGEEAAGSEVAGDALAALVAQLGTTLGAPPAAAVADICGAVARLRGQDASSVQHQLRCRTLGTALW